MNIYMNMNMEEEKEYRKNDPSPEFTSINITNNDNIIHTFLEFQSVK